MSEQPVEQPVEKTVEKPAEVAAPVVDERAWYEKLWEVIFPWLKKGAEKGVEELQKPENQQKIAEAAKKLMDKDKKD